MHFLKRSFSSLTSAHWTIIGVVFAIFLVSANMAWLNPNPDYVVKTNERIPIMWQYNGDSTVEFLSAAYFPQYFKVDKTRTNRPGYPLAAKILAEGYALLARPVHKLGILAAGMLGYITLKLCVYLLGALALYAISKRYLPERAALYGVLLCFLHPFAVTFAATFHTSELEFITPVFLVWMWFSLGDAYSHKKNVLFSLIAGYLMLTKQNYAVYLALLAFSFLILKRYKESILSFAVHLIPFGLWLVALKFLHIPYYNHETQAAGQGVWLYQDLIFRNPIEVAKVLGSSVHQWLDLIASYFSISLFLALLALGVPAIRERLNRRSIIFILFVLTMSWFQTLAANRYAPYMSADLAFITFPLAGYALYRLFERFSIRKLAPLFFTLYLLLGLTSMMRFPWVSPFDQVSITHPDRVKLLEEGKLVPRN